MNAHEARHVIADLFGDWQKSVSDARKLDAWYRNTNPSEDLSMPSKQEYGPSGWEYRELADVSRNPYADVIVTAVSQQQYVEDHRKTSESKSSKVFTDTWRPNGMPARQLAIHRGANAHGQAFVTTLPGKIPGTEKFLPVVRGESATKMVTFFDEDTDEFPVYALWGEREEYAKGNFRYRFRLYDDEKVFHFAAESPGGSYDQYEIAGVDIHDIGIPPVHRFAPRLDLEGRAIGDIQRAMTVLRRLDQDTFDRMIIQRFQAWQVRYATGLMKPKTQEEQAAAEMMLRISDLLVGGVPLDKDGNPVPGVEPKFGVLPGQDMTSILKAKDSDQRDLSAISQVPAYQIAGTIENVSADGLAMMQAGLARHAEEIRVSYGQTWDQVERTCAYMLHANTGEAAYLDLATDYETTTIWRDTEIRSLAHAADALGKLSDQLGIPPEVLWRRIPGWQKIDDDLARDLIEKNEMLVQLQQIIGDGVDLVNQREGAAGQQQAAQAPTAVPA